MVEFSMTSDTIAAIWDALDRRATAAPQTEAVGLPAHLLGSECDLALFNTLRWVSPPRPRGGKNAALADQIALDKGFLIDALISAGIKVDVASDERGTPWKFSLMDGMVHGRSDGIGIGIVEAPAAVHAVMTKSLTAKDFRAVKKHGLLKAKPEHWHGLHASMQALPTSRGAYIAVNRETRDILMERVKPDPHVAARQEARVAGLVASTSPPMSLITGMTAAQMESARQRPPCLFCDHQGKCFDALMPRMHCRTCVHFSFTARGAGHCAHLDVPLTPLEQRQGATCPTHLHLPGLIPAEQIDADGDAMTITYRFSDGTEWTDGPTQGEPT
jgi:hypothetical protein